MARDKRLGGLPLKMVSLLMALVMWIALSGRLDQEAISDERIFPQVSLVHQNIPSSMRLKTDQYQILVAVRGPQSELNDLNANDIKVQLDLKGMRDTTYNLPLTAANVTLPPQHGSLEVAYILPNMVRLTLEHVTSKQVKIFMRTTGRPAPNYELKDLVLKPEVVDIEGPTEFLRDIEFLVAESVNIEGAQGSIQGNVTFDFKTQVPPETVILQDLNQLSFTAVIEERRDQITFDQDFTVRVSASQPLVAVPTVARPQIEGPVSILEWIKPEWLYPRVLVPPDSVVGGQILPNGGLGGPGSTAPDPDQPVSFKLETVWEVPDEIQAAAPNWRARLSKLTVTWAPALVEVHQP